MKNKDAVIHFNEYEIAKSFYLFSAEAKDHMKKILNSTNDDYKSFFELVIRFMLFNNEYSYTPLECRKYIVRYACLFVYVCFKDALGTIREFERLLKNPTMNYLEAELSGKSNKLLAIYQSCAYSNQFIKSQKKSKIYEKIHKILGNDSDYFSKTNNKLESYKTNRSSFDLMICDQAFNKGDNFKLFDINLVDSNEYQNYIKLGNDVNLLVIAYFLNEVIHSKNINGLIQLEPRSYFRIVNVGNTSTKIAPINVSLIYLDEKTNKAKIAYEVLKKDLVFYCGGCEYVVSRDKKQLLLNK